MSHSNGPSVQDTPNSRAGSASGRPGNEPEPASSDATTAAGRSVQTPATGIWIFPDAAAPELVDLARHAETLGLDELWVGDEGPARDPFGILAAAAAVTDRIRLATGITNPYVRHPAVSAVAMLTIHELSGGRAVLGVGAGGHMSLAPFGLHAHQPYERVREFIETARAVAAGVPTAGYSPPDVAIDEAAVGAPMPLFVGARGPRLNRLASQRADGAFVAGMPPFRYPAVIGWARSQNPINIALYPSVAFSDEAVERHRPEMIWGLLDTPPEVRDELGIDLDAARAAAAAMRSGDPAPARRMIDDDLLARLMLVGHADRVGAALAELVREHRPASIGLALVQDDLHQGASDAAAAFAAMAAELEE